MNTNKKILLFFFIFIVAAAVRIRHRADNSNTSVTPDINSNVRQRRDSHGFFPTDEDEYQEYQDEQEEREEQDEREEQEKQDEQEEQEEQDEQEEQEEQEEQGEQEEQMEEQDKQDEKQESSVTNNLTPDEVIVEAEENEETAQNNDTTGSKILPQQSIVAASSVIDSESIVVNNFGDMKKALSENNGYVNIYLGANIDMEPLGIEIHSSKKRVLISGINPLNGTGPFTINEYNSLDPVYAIRVVSNAGTKEVIMRDINVTGRNFYGAICVYDVAFDVKVIFDNVNYNGPQISYNRGGTVCITGSSDIRITGENGLSEGHELAEAKILELGGNALINHYAPVVSGIWLVGEDSHIRVLEGARVTWNETGTYMIFQDNQDSAALTLENDAQLTINTINGLFYNDSVLLHQFGDVLIGRNAVLEINQRGGASATPVMKVKDSFQALDNASLILTAQSAPQLIYITGASNFSAISPDVLTLYNKTGRLISRNGTGSYNISILSSFMNYWSAPCDLEILGGFDDFPQHRWRKKNGADLSVEITASSSQTTSVASNYAGEDYGAAPDKASLNMQAARIITAGKMLLDIDAVTNSSRYISGQTEPYAKLRATYTDAQGAEKTVYGEADSGGAFDIRLESGSVPLIGSTVVVFSSLGYKNVFETTVVGEALENTLALIHVPKDLIFPKTAITAKKEVIARMDSNWHIIIADTRNQGSEWELFVRLKEPLVGQLHGSEIRLDNAVVFKNSDEAFVTLTETSTKAAKGARSDEAETLIAWQPNEGVMLYVDTLKAFSGVAYSAKIEWLLVDAP